MDPRPPQYSVGAQVPNGSWPGLVVAPGRPGRIVLAPEFPQVKAIAEFVSSRVD